MGTPQGREGPHLSRGPPDQGHPPPPFKNKGSVSPREPWGQAGTPTPRGRWGPWGQLGTSKPWGTWRHAQHPPPRAGGVPGKLGTVNPRGRWGHPGADRVTRGTPLPSKLIGLCPPGTPGDRRGPPPPVTCEDPRGTTGDIQAPAQTSPTPPRQSGTGRDSHPPWQVGPPRGPLGTSSDTPRTPESPRVAPHRVRLVGAAGPPLGLRRRDGHDDHRCGGDTGTGAAPGLCHLPLREAGGGSAPPPALHTPKPSGGHPKEGTCSPTSRTDLGGSRSPGTGGKESGKSAQAAFACLKAEEGVSVLMKPVLGLLQGGIFLPELF